MGQRFDDQTWKQLPWQAREAHLDAIEADLISWYDQPLFIDAVAA